jgi:hypothetical protein
MQLQDSARAGEALFVDSSLACPDSQTLRTLRARVQLAR